MKKVFPAFLLLITGLLFAGRIHAQTAQLSIQGILKKADGKAVDDGTYSITFKLYTVAENGTAIWTESQPNVEVASGIYSVLLGSVTPLNITFDQPYYLGVGVGSTGEMLPRMRLSAAPYALSLLGSSNKFPSSGLVQADAVTVAGNETVSGNETVTGNATVSGNGIIVGKLAIGGSGVAPNHSVIANGGFLARGGDPGPFGNNNNGYAFSNEGASGMFRYEDGKVGIYSDGLKMISFDESQGTGSVFVTVPFRPTLTSGSGNAVLVDNGGKLIVSSSSARYKNDITDLKENFGLLLQARPKKYTRKETPGVWEVGFIAEEMDALGLKFLVNYDLQGRPDGLSYDKFVVYLVPLLREQNEKVSKLEAENAELRKMFSSLRADVDALKNQR